MLSRVPVHNWILIGFVLALAGWVVLAEVLPGRRGTDDRPRDGDRDDADQEPERAADVRLAA